MVNYVQETIDGNFHRMLSDGVQYRDLTELRETIREPDMWCDAWMAAATVHEGLGRAALGSGARLTAGVALWRGALYCHFAQGYFTDKIPDKKRLAEVRKQHLFAEAALLIDPPLRRVEIPFRGEVAPAYLRLPKDTSKAALVVIFGGLDSTKEDSLTISDLVLQRGMATLAFDGPGQGEMFHRMKLIPRFEEAVSAVIDFAAALPEIDPERIGIIGRSTGGHWAIQTAARDRRVKAAVAWAMAYSAKNLDKLPESVANRWLRACGVKTIAEAMAYFKDYDLDGVVAKIGCPVMVVQGGQDPIVQADGVELLRRHSPQPVEVLTWPDSGHCCHDRSYITKPAMADFLARHLLTRDK